MVLAMTQTLSPPRVALTIPIGLVSFGNNPEMWQTCLYPRTLALSAWVPKGREGFYTVR